MDLDQDRSYVILNKLSARESWQGPFIAGQLIQLQDGTDLQGVTQSLDEDTEEFLLRNLDIGETNRVVRGVLYFVANSSHVGLVEGHQVRGKTLERYLTRLLQDTGLLEPAQVITLPSRIEVADGSGLARFKELTIAAKKNDSDNQDRIIERERASGDSSGSTVFDVLRALGWSAEALARLQSEIPDNGWIEGSFRVAIKSKRSRRVDVPREALEEALRNIDPTDLSLRGDGMEKAGLTTLSVSKSVKAHSQILDPTDVFAKIKEAMQDWANEGRIDCTFQ